MRRRLRASMLLAFQAVVAQRQNVSALTTSYGFDDNCLPGAEIAHPVKHRVAGGTGTYADPITYAGDTKATPAGTIIYNFKLKKVRATRYFIMEDDCEECQSDWKKKDKYHFDMWTGPPTFSNASALIACENAITADNQLVEIDAVGTYPVDVTPLFNNVTNACIVPATPCHDVGNKCGNSCQIPNAANCTELEAIFHLSSTRFLQLNPKLNCSKEIKAGTNVCQGGSCGD